MSAQAAKKEPAKPAKESAGKSAKDAPEAAKQDEAAPKKSKLPLIIIAAVVLLAGGGGAYFAFKPKAAAAADAAADTKTGKSDKSDKSDKGAKKGPPLYYKFDPAFVVNFGGEGSARYLQVTVEAMARDQAILNTLKDDEPAVRNDLVMLFSSQDNATLMSAEGKEKLRASTLDTVRKVLNEEGAKGSQLEAVYFTSFVIQ